MLLNYAKEKKGNKIADATLWNFLWKWKFSFFKSKKFVNIGKQLRII